MQHFDHGADGQELTVAEPYRRVFATLRPDGGFSLFSTIQPQPLLNTRLGAEVQQIAFAPRGVACCWKRAGLAALCARQPVSGRHLAFAVGQGVV